MRKIVCFVFVLTCCLISCNKKDFLEEKPKSDMFVPTTLEDFQLLLDNDFVMSETPVLGELSADNFYTTYPYWQISTVKEQNAYLWLPDIYKEEGAVGDWNLPYQQVFYANVILDGLPKLVVTVGQENLRRSIEGSALFIRAYAFYNLAQIFSPAYNDATAAEDLGIPLRLSPNIDERVQRSKVKETYEKIIKDLISATQLLEDLFTKNNKNRPAKVTAYALLARVYLSMRKYDKARLYADSSLRLYNTLIDYNDLNQGTNRPFDRYNDETLYQSKVLSSTGLMKTVKDCIVDTGLYKSYTTNDLRKVIFFAMNVNNQAILKNSYNGSIFPFTGFATDEMYLIRAECYAREGKTSEALNDLNSLLIKRWRKNTFVPFTAQNSDEALAIILTERRKELPFRGVRWTDLRRYNLEGANIKLTRVLDGQTYTLLPNSRLYVLPIPPDVILLSGIEQNKRE